MFFQRMLRKSFLIIGMAALCVSAAWAGQWSVLGPEGGDVRSLTADPGNPDHIILGTSTGTLFISKDGGHSWARFARLGGDDYVLDRVEVDPQNSNTIYAAAWSVDNQQAGDLFRSQNGGKTWETLPGMHGKSIRAFSISHTNSKILTVGALDGVFRSTDGGDSWKLISPANHGDIKNIESLAVDPKDPSTVYAGTWHLAWKTADGGASWKQIKKGMIDDSDVFSIIVDSSNPSVVFASACSGIYKSETSGELFSKVQGIPFSARRTRVLKQDPSNPAIVYAGTTEGLWKTSDLGKTWKRVSNPEVVVNDVLVDPRNSNRVLLATDRGGVLASDDGAATWTASNRGYTHRYVTAIVADQKDPATWYVGVVNDREWGGVFVSRDRGQSWQQKSSGLGGRDVFALQQSTNGDLIAGTNKGAFLLARNGSQWQPINAIVNEKSSYRTVLKGKKKVKVETKTASRSVLSGRVSDVEVVGNRWLAATSSGLLSSSNQGKSWSGGPVLGKADFVAVKADGNLLVAATRSQVLVSSDSGSTWKQAALPSYLVVKDLTVAPGGQVLVASREGAYRSGDSGATWERALNGLPDKNISSVSYDPAHKRLLATSSATGVVFESQDNGKSWHRGPDVGYPLRAVSVAHGRLLAATPFDGIVVQPESDAQSASAEMGSSN
jgi:photosystem II stability/assembly factor-like uncharacterized protein